MKGLRYEIQRLVHKVGHNCRIPLQMKGFNNFDSFLGKRSCFFLTINLTGSTFIIQLCRLLLIIVAMDITYQVFADKITTSLSKVMTNSKLFSVDTRACEICLQSFNSNTKIGVWDCANIFLV